MFNQHPARTNSIISASIDYERELESRRDIIQRGQNRLVSLSQEQIR